MSVSLKVLIIGARRHRQGLGEFVARYFQEANARVVAVVGTNANTIAQACEKLSQYRIACRGYTSLQRALEQEEPEIVAICSPYQFHYEHLLAVAQANAHCLCEKPLWWDELRDLAPQTERLMDGFVRRGKYLALQTQWPCTLSAFYRIYPHIYRQPISTFEMELSPLSTGVDMIIDSISHPLSMLYSLLGLGRVNIPKCRYLNTDRSRVQMDFEFIHASGTTEVSCRFTTTLRPPRPAAYAINGLRVERTIQLPQYQIYFHGDGKEVLVKDPLQSLIEDFLTKVNVGEKTDSELLIRSMRDMESLVESAR